MSWQGMFWHQWYIVVNTSLRHMSDLADAVFGGELMGHVMAGDSLSSSAIVDAAITADLAANLIDSHDHVSDAEHVILQAKVAEHVLADGEYSPCDIVHDHMQSDLDVGLVNHYMA